MGNIAILNNAYTRTYIRNLRVQREREAQRRHWFEVLATLIAIICWLPAVIMIVTF